MEVLSAPWPWYVSGPLIALTMALLIGVGERFGMSSNLRTVCAALGGGKWAGFFRFDWKRQSWNLLVALGVVFGGFIADRYLSNGATVELNEQTISRLEALGFADAGSSYLPEALFGRAAFSDFGTLSLLLLGGLFVGFGARYAGGCTSGHAISGLSNLQLPSLIAVLGFFAGGLIMVHLIFPILF